MGPTEGWPRGSEVGHRGPLRTDTVSVRCGGGFEKVAFNSFRRQPTAVTWMYLFELRVSSSMVPCGTLVMVLPLEVLHAEISKKCNPTTLASRKRKVTR